MLSKLIRRTHMYLALFLAPWVLMYALSTMAMNHRGWFHHTPQWEKEREQDYTAVFPPGAGPRWKAEQILTDLGLQGSFGVTGNAPDGRLTILRQHPVSPRRVTYSPVEGKVVIEKQVFHGAGFLERMHRRRGYQQPYPLEDAWAFSVDLVIIAMVFWVASGLWMWWEMKATRRWGAVFGLLGVGIFAFFLATI